LQLDTTYTAKTFAAVLARPRDGSRVLFWNTFSSVPLEDRPRAAVDELPAGVRRMAFRLALRRPSWEPVPEDREP
jgi:hypothetical protein